MITNDLGWVEGRLAFSFANLMELRFIAFFADAGVSLREIRAIMGEALREMARPRPFATNLVFRTDGEKIIAEIVKKNGDHSLYDLKSRNFEIGLVVYKSLKDGVVYDAKGEAQAWFPRKEIAPNVIVHRSLAFGRPVLKGYGIPTEAIMEAVKAEGSVAAAAALFEISPKRAAEAVVFEESMRKAA